MFLFLNLSTIKLTRLPAFAPFQPISHSVQTKNLFTAIQDELLLDYAVCLVFARSSDAYG